MLGAFNFSLFILSLFIRNRFLIALQRYDIAIAVFECSGKFFQENQKITPLSLLHCCDVAVLQFSKVAFYTQKILLYLYINIVFIFAIQ